MDFATLLSYVYVETNRPDLEAETKSAVFASILKMHGMDFFYKDMKTVVVAFDTAAYFQQLETQMLLGFRNVSFIRKYDPAYQQYQLGNTNSLPSLGTGVPNPSLGLAMFKIISPDDLFDDYMSERVDVAYQAGATINMKSSTIFKFVTLGYYAWPTLDMEHDGAGLDSWVAREHPYAIIYDAASAILQKTGMTDASRKYDAEGGLVDSQIRILRMSNTQPVGY